MSVPLAEIVVEPSKGQDAFLFTEPGYEVRFGKERGALHAHLTRLEHQAWYPRMNVVQRTVVLIAGLSIFVLHPDSKELIKHISSYVSSIPILAGLSFGHSLRNVFFLLVGVTMALIGTGINMSLTQYTSGVYTWLCFVFIAFLGQVMVGFSANITQLKIFLGFTGVWTASCFLKNESWLYLGEIYLSFFGVCAVTMFMYVFPTVNTTSNHISVVCHRMVANLSRVFYILNKGFITSSKDPKSVVMDEKTKEKMSTLAAHFQVDMLSPLSAAESNNAEQGDSVSNVPEHIEYAHYSANYCIEAQLQIKAVEADITEIGALLPNLEWESYVYRVIVRVFCFWLKPSGRNQRNLELPAYVLYMDDKMDKSTKANNVLNRDMPDKTTPSIGSSREYTQAPYSVASVNIFLGSVSYLLSNLRGMQKSQTDISDMSIVNNQGALLHHIFRENLKEDMKKVALQVRDVATNAMQKNPHIEHCDSIFTEHFFNAKLLHIQNPYILEIGKHTLRFHHLGPLHNVFARVAFKLYRNSLEEQYDFLKETPGETLVPGCACMCVTPYTHECVCISNMVAVPGSLCAMYLDSYTFWRKYSVIRQDIFKLDQHVSMKNANTSAQQLFQQVHSHQSSGAYVGGGGVPHPHIPMYVPPPPPSEPSVSKNSSIGFTVDEVSVLSHYMFCYDRFVTNFSNTLIPLFLPYLYPFGNVTTTMPPDMVLPNDSSSELCTQKYKVVNDDDMTQVVHRLNLSIHNTHVHGRTSRSLRSLGKSKSSGDIPRVMQHDILSPNELVHPSKFAIVEGDEGNESEAGQGQDDVVLQSPASPVEPLVLRSSQNHSLRDQHIQVPVHPDNLIISGNLPAPPTVQLANKMPTLKIAGNPVVSHVVTDAEEEMITSKHGPPLRVDDVVISVSEPAPVPAHYIPDEYVFDVFIPVFLQKIVNCIGHMCRPVPVAAQQHCMKIDSETGRVIANSNGPAPQDADQGIEMPAPVADSFFARAKHMIKAEFSLTDASTKSLKIIVKRAVALALASSIVFMDMGIHAGERHWAILTAGLLLHNNTGSTLHVIEERLAGTTLGAFLGYFVVVARRAFSEPSVRVDWIGILLSAFFLSIATLPQAYKKHVFSGNYTCTVAMVTQMLIGTSSTDTEYFLLQRVTMTMFGAFCVTIASIFMWPSSGSTAVQVQIRDAMKESFSILDLNFNMLQMALFHGSGMSHKLYGPSLQPAASVNGVLEYVDPVTHQKTMYGSYDDLQAALKTHLQSEKKNEKVRYSTAPGVFSKHSVVRYMFQAKFPNVVLPQLESISMQVYQTQMITTLRVLRSKLAATQTLVDDAKHENSVYSDQLTSVLHNQAHLVRVISRMNECQCLQQVLIAKMPRVAAIDKAIKRSFYKSSTNLSRSASHHSGGDVVQDEIVLTQKLSTEFHLFYSLVTENLRSLILMLSERITNTSVRTTFSLPFALFTKRRWEKRYDTKQWTAMWVTYMSCFGKKMRVRARVDTSCVAEDELELLRCQSNEDTKMENKQFSVANNALAGRAARPVREVPHWKEERAVIHQVVMAQTRLLETYTRVCKVRIARTAHHEAAMLPSLFLVIEQAFITATKSLTSCLTQLGLSIHALTFVEQGQ